MDTYICIYTYSFYTHGQQGGSLCSRACTKSDNPSSLSWTHKVERVELTSTSGLVNSTWVLYTHRHITHIDTMK